MGEFAFRFLQMCLKNKSPLLYSDIILIELKNAPNFLLTSFFDSFKDLLVEVIYSKEQALEANNIAISRGIPYNDALHAVLARDNGAIMVTRDRHFELLSDIVEVRAPEEIISR